MPKNFKLILIYLAYFLPLSAYIGDNRFIPLFPRHRLDIDGLGSVFSVEAWVSAANRSINDRQRDVGLADIYGDFDLIDLSNAINDIGKTSPLPPEITTSIPWNIDGRRQIQGAGFWFHIWLLDYLSVGGSCYFLRSNVRHEFFLDETKNNDSLLIGMNPLNLDAVRREMLVILGLQENHISQIGFGDVDLYLRFGHIWHYLFKMRRIDAGLRFGIAFPSGERRNIMQPASAPFGGDGHWGVYLHGESLFEVKEDIKAGFAVRVIQRFSRTSQQRVSANKEPYVFGAIVGDVRIEPGVTALFSPFVLAENLRGGFGMGAYYWLQYHAKDHAYDARPAGCEPPMRLSTYERLSSWGSEHFTLHAFYDFGKLHAIRDFDPIVSFRWDVPASFFITNRVEKTHRITLSFDMAF